MSNVLKFSAIIAALLVIIAVQWRALSDLRRENGILRQRAIEAEQTHEDSERQRRSNITDQSVDDFQGTEVLALRSQIQSLRDELGQATNRASQLVLSSEQLALALRGGADLPRRILPPVGPLPKTFDQYRIQMRYTGLTTVLQKREPDGSYADVIEGLKDIGFGEKHLMVWCEYDPSRMSGSWVFIDLDTGQINERTSTGVEADPYIIPEGKAATWLKRSGDPNDPQNWKVLFK